MTETARFDWRTVGLAFDAVAARHAEFVDHGPRTGLDVLVRATLRHVFRSPGLTVLDLGCGSGQFAAMAAARGHEVHAVDASERLLALARARLASYRRVRFTRGDAVDEARSAPLPYDVVLSVVELVSYVPSPLDFVSAVATALRPGGVFFGTYIRTTVLARASKVASMPDPGDGVIFCERPAGEAGVPALWARAIDDRRMIALLAAAGFSAQTIVDSPDSTCGAFVRVGPLVDNTQRSHQHAYRGRRGSRDCSEAMSR